MVGPLRSAGMHASSESDSAIVNSDLSALDKLLVPLQESISQISCALENIKVLFERKFEEQNITIGKLLKKVTTLEKSVTVLESTALFNAHIASMHERKMDDMEQYSRKTNLRVEGIPVVAGDSPLEIMEMIKDECGELDLEVCGDNFDRCHRIGPRYTINGVTHQSVILKLALWRTRDTLYRNRKKFSFKLFPDLTSRRSELLRFCREEIASNIGKVPLPIDYVFADLNCRLKVKSFDGRFLSFNSRSEFYSTILKIEEDSGIILYDLPTLED